MTQRIIFQIGTLFLLLLVFPGCQKTVDPPVTEVNLVQSRFVLPGDGVRNNNSYIGDFCCTGETATVKNSEGKAVGYVYFFSWDGQAYNVGERSIMSDFRLLLSGAFSLSNPTDTRRTDSVYLKASEMNEGASVQIQVGELYYTVTILSVEKVTYQNQEYFYNDSLVIEIEVDPA